VYQKDQKLENAGKFIVEREDHTIGNVVRMQLLEDPRVDFAGYRMTHPLEHRIYIQVHTTPDYNPADAMITACNNLIDKLNRLEEKFDAEVSRKQHETRY
jgi:DNA-directed RNA polymerase II subunit RPB11